MILANNESITVSWVGGRGVMYSVGSTWNAATLTLTWSDTSTGTFVPIGSGVSLSADGCTGYEIPYGYIKFEVTGGDGSTSINCGAGTTSNAR